MKSNFITVFFNKDPKEIFESDVREYFKTRQEESSTLEFKSGDVEINDVFKEVTAFLNTEGGLLIIGAPRENKETIGKRVIKYCQGDIKYSKFLSKEWLYQKFFTNITPSPTDIFIKEIISEEGNIYIVDIPQSTIPPHQSNADGRYYIRIDSEAKPAPHGLVQALFDKRRKPKLSASLERNNINPEVDSISISLHNESPIPADKVAFIIDVYNVTGVDSEHCFKKINDVLGIKFSLSESTQQILVRIISIGINFRVTHITKKYLIAINYWSKEVDFDCTFFVINPINNTIEFNHWLEEDANLLNKLKKLND